VSINSPRAFNVPLADLPSFTTVPLSVPGGDSGRWHCEPGAALVLQANVETSVSGLVYVAVLDGASGEALPGMALGDADPVRGNFLRKTVSWRGNATWGGGLRGGRVALRVAMADAKLYSVAWVCAIT